MTDIKKPSPYSFPHVRLPVARSDGGSTCWSIPRAGLTLIYECAIRLTSPGVLDVDGVCLLNNRDIDGIGFGYVDNLTGISVSHLRRTDFEILEGLMGVGLKMRQASLGDRDLPSSVRTPTN